jgi:phage terminase large subunit-like protein
VAARYIKTGVVKFPRKGAEQLITQLLGFGSEKHDDAVDALVYLIFRALFVWPLNRVAYG